MPSIFGTEPDYRRIEAVLRRQTPDRVPLYEYFSDPGVQAAAIGSRADDTILPSGPDPQRNAHIRNQYHLGYDYLIAGVCFGFAAGARKKAVDTEGRARDFLDDAHAPIQSWADFERYRWPAPSDVDYGELEYMSSHLPEGMRVVANLGGGLLEWAMWLMGAERFCLAIYDQPDLVQSMLFRISDQQTAVAAVAASRPEVLACTLGDDMGFKTQTFLPPATLRELIFPGLQRIAEAVHAAGKPFALHSCGNLAEVMDDLIGRVGIDAKHSFEDVIMPVAEAKRRWGEKVALLGGVDVDALCRAPEQKLRAHVRRIVEECGPRGFAVGSGNSIPSYIPPESLFAMNDEAVRCQRQS